MEYTYAKYQRTICSADMNEQVNIREKVKQCVEALKDHEANSQRRLQWSGTFDLV